MTAATAGPGARSARSRRGRSGFVPCQTVGGGANTCTGGQQGHGGCVHFMGASGEGLQGFGVGVCGWGVYSVYSASQCRVMARGASADH